MAPGYAGIDNELFYRDYAMMLFGDGRSPKSTILFKSFSGFDGLFRSERGVGKTKLVV